MTDFADMQDQGNYEVEAAGIQTGEMDRSIETLLAGYAAQNRKYRKRIQENQDTITELRKTADTAERLKDRIAELELENRTYEARFRTMDAQLVQALEQLREANGIIDGIAHSKSWKITAPLRGFKAVMCGKKNVQAPTAVMAASASCSESPVRHLSADPADMLPESLYQNRPEVDAFVENLAGYDVVSFDIFDTLILRTFDVPTDVFRLVGHRIGEESFAKLRVQAEKEARQHHRQKNGEVNIYEIYEELSRYISIDTEAVIRQELEAEKDCCFANPFMKAVYDELLRRGQKVIIVSDMYLPGELVRELLHSCGYEGYSKLYVSCDYGAGKWDKRLYPIVERDNPECETYIHVGDNKASDVSHAKKNGWDAVHYPACRELGGELRAKDMDRLSVSAYNGIVNAHLHADSSVYSPEYEHGFRYAGYLVCGFCEWLNRYVEENKIDRILFLARDADILYKVYNRHYRKVDNRYMVVSRLATWIMAFETDTEAFIQNFFQTRANLGTQTIAKALEETDMEVLIPLLEDAGLDGNSKLTQHNYQKLRSFIYENKAVAVKHYASSKQAGQDYFREMIGDAKRVCAVDIGWSGQILITMRKIVRDMYHGEVTLQGAYMALTDNAAASGYAESGIITPWLFHGCMNRDVAINTATVEGDMQAKFMEATFTSEQPTLLKYMYGDDGKQDDVYGIMSASSDLVQPMQKGVLDFAEQWIQKTHIFGSNVRIMPTDAKRVMDLAITNFRYCYAIMGDVQEWEYPLPNFRGDGSLTTLGTMLKKKRMV